ncbi:MAG: zinc ribbon domain-containing protein [Deltaproteobacteria bacterium]|nr:zinc ribbon domain-containing protein [Deltaproteobacteria bacterium]
MFFFIAGIQPKTTILDEHPRMCPSCGLLQAVLKRRDHYFSFFFLPIIRVKKGEPLLECRSCGALTRETGEPLYHAAKGHPGLNCPYCGNPVAKEFRFCPFCGKPV